MSNLKIRLSSVLYSLAQITLGFLLHPYQTVRGLVADRYLTFLVLIPTVILLILIVLWRFVIFPIFDSFSFAGGYYTQLVKFTVLFFCLQWQALIGYLYVKFWLALRH